MKVQIKPAATQKPLVFPALFESIHEDNSESLIVLFVSETRGISIKYPEGHFHKERIDWETCKNTSVWKRMPEGTEITLTQV